MVNDTLIFHTKAQRFWDIYHERDMGVPLSPEESANLLFTSSRIGTTNSESFLEIGCGSGKNLSHYIGSFGHISGCDISDVAVREAAYRLGNTCTIRKCAFDLIPFNAESFDVVLLCKTLGVVSHKECLQALAWNASSMVKPGGVLIVVDFAVSESKVDKLAGSDSSIVINTQWSELPFLHFTHRSLMHLFPRLCLRSFRYKHLLSCNRNVHLGIIAHFFKEGG